MGVVYVTIKDRITTVQGDIELVCNNPTDIIEIGFDAEWEGKTGFVARFAWANKYIEVPFTGNRVQVPEIVNTNYVFFGVYADNIASTPTKINCKKSILCLGDNVRHPPANPFYDDFAERLGNVEDAIFAKSGDKPLIFDTTLSDASNYIWLGDIGYKEIFIKIDYPKGGIGIAQNVTININDFDAKRTWHTANTTCMAVQANVSDIVLWDGTTKQYACMTRVAVGSVLNMEYQSSGYVETPRNNIGWASISCSSIPAGTRIRIWGIE